MSNQTNEQPNRWTTKLMNIEQTNKWTSKLMNNQTYEQPN